MIAMEMLSLRNRHRIVGVVVVLSVAALTWHTMGMSMFEKHLATLDDLLMAWNEFVDEKLLDASLS